MLHGNLNFMQAACRKLLQISKLLSSALTHFPFFLRYRSHYPPCSADILSMS